MPLFSVYASFMHKKINKKRYGIEDSGSDVFLFNNYSKQEL